MQIIGTEHRDALRQPNHASPSPHSPSLPHVIELEPVISYPLAHVNSHVGLSEAAPPVHEAPAVVVEAVTMMNGHVAGVTAGESEPDVATATAAPIAPITTTATTAHTFHPRHAPPAAALFSTSTTRPTCTSPECPCFGGVEEEQVEQTDAERTWMGVGGRGKWVRSIRRARRGETK